MIADNLATSRVTETGSRRLFLGCRLWPVIVLAAGLETARCQVVLDGKFGTSGALSGPNYNIPSSVGAIRENNLFQSFSQFDLKAGDVANFTGPANIQNIMSRVTGGSPSSIDGTIRSGISGANFYFINPSGVVFGPNASVDVSGAFAVSTANYLKLADDAKFMASLDADDSMLSSAPVAAFGFLEGASGNIEVRGSLRSSPGTPLSVIGSTVSVRDGASLEALGSQISLAGVSAAGEVTPSIPSSIKGGLSANTDVNSPGTVVIRGGRLVVENAQVDVSSTGGDLKVQLSDSLEMLSGGRLTTASSGSTRGGNILIEAPAVTVDSQDGPLATRIAAETASDDILGAGGNIVIRSESFELKRGAEVSVSTFGAADAGLVDIAAGVVKVLGTEAPVPPTQISANAAGVSGAAAGAGGKIVINADSLEVTLGAVVSASTLGDANAGTIDINAKSISIQNGSVTTYSSGAGNGGDVRVNSESLTLDGMFGSITALAIGLNSQFPGGLPAGKGGNIDIKTGSLKIVNDSAIAAGTFGDGAAGNVTITADSIVLDTGHPQPGIFPGISSTSSLSFDGTPNSAKGGNVVLKTGSLEMHNGMTISVATSTPGSGGNIDIQVGSVTLDSSAAIQSSSDGEGHAGTVSLKSSGDVLLASGGFISTSAPLSSAGEINVTVGNDLQLTDSQITARAGPGGGGNINIESPNLVYLLHGALDTQAVGDGGNLTITRPVFVVLNEGTLISKSSSANGGNITINSDFFLTSASVIDASAPFGLPGTVSVTAPNVDLSGSLVALPSTMLDASALLRPDCGVRLQDDISSFTVMGRGGLPLEPGGFVPSGAAPPANEKK